MKIEQKIIAEKLIFLDCALTGKPFKSALHTWENSAIRDPLDLLDRLYYLSDGGYSRVYAIENDDGTASLRLASESLEHTKIAWKRSKELIADIENTINVAIKLAE